MSAAQRPEPRRNLRTPILETKIKLPTDQPCQIYPRVSTPEQKKNVSAEMQQDKSFATKCGWTEDLIIIDKRDLGVSGQLRMEDREAFRDMLRRMPETAGKERIRAVIVRDVSRLFRNKWGDEPGKFMEICYRYNVLVVTADFVYDFSVNWHIDKFKRKCEEAWSHIENHVYGVMLPARDERAYAGYWTGGNLPVGYSLDRREKIKGEENPNYNKFIIYEKHAKVVRWIFRRYKQLNGNVRALYREIERLEKPLIPDFDEDVPEEVISNLSTYKKVPGGYTIASDAGLRRVLTNRVYIGYWIYCGELVSTNNHSAIVDYDDFMFAYNRLSPINLDGTPNEEALRNRRKYARRFTTRDGLLKECIEAADPQLNVYPKPSHGKWNYGLYKRGRSSSDGSPLSVLPCMESDDIVLRKLVARMTEPQAEKDFAGFLAYEDKSVKEASEAL
jgi:DNA invertase Pin-like site-specific DNA recombinase